MKPMILVPPAQAEALSDTQEYLRSGETLLRQPWRDEDSSEEPFPFTLMPRQSKDASKAQLWPSSVNSSR